MLVPWFSVYVPWLFLYLTSKVELVVDGLYQCVSREFSEE